MLNVDVDFPVVHFARADFFAEPFAGAFVEFCVGVFRAIFEPKLTVGWFYGGNQNVQNSFFNLLLSFHLNGFFLGCPHHIDGLLDQVAHHTFYVAAYIPYLRKFGGFHFDKRRIGDFSQPTGNFRFADARSPNHQDVVGRNFALHIGAAVHPAPAVPQGYSYVAFGIVLANNVLI